MYFDGNGTADLNLSTGNSFGALPNTGLAAADLFIGSAHRYVNQLNSPLYHFNNQEIATYFQDDFRVLKNLTLNLGVRWELHPAVHELGGLFSTVDLANHAVVTQTPPAQLVSSGLIPQTLLNSYLNLGVKFETPQQAGVSQNLVDDYLFTFAPRLGVAWRVRGDGHSLVLRGGHGTYIYPIPVRNYYFGIMSNPPSNASATRDFEAANQSPDGKANYLLRAPQVLVAGQNSAGAISTANGFPLSVGVNTSFIDPHDSPPTYVRESNITLEQAIKTKQVVRLSLIQTHGTNLEQDWEYNQAPSDYVYYTNTGLPKPTGPLSGIALNPYDSTVFNQVEDQRKTGRSNDYSAQVNFQRSYSSGYAFQAFYVWLSFAAEGMASATVRSFPWRTMQMAMRRPRSTRAKNCSPMFATRVFLGTAFASTT